MPPGRLRGTGASTFCCNPWTGTRWRGPGSARPARAFGFRPTTAPVSDGAITLQATATPDNARLLAARAFALDRLAASYARFNAAFAALPGWRDPAPGEAMVARTLLIHEYRRLVLQAPALPAEILPDELARRCTARVAVRGRPMRALLPASEAWLDRAWAYRGGCRACNTASADTVRRQPCCVTDLQLTLTSFL